MDTEQLFARIDGSALYQPFYERIYDVLDSLQKEGIYYYATCGYRTFEEQDALYQKGRRGIAGEGKVTNARAGSSAHQYKAALDGCRDGDVAKAGLQPVWKTEDYRPLADRAVEKGLEAGFNWKSLSDAPHVQLPLTGKGITIAKLKEIYLAEGQEAVSAFLDEFDW